MKSIKGNPRYFYRFKNPCMHTKRSPQREKGQGLVEYGMILVMVGVVVIIILALLGPSIGKVFSTIIAVLPGGSESNWTYCAVEHDYCSFSGTVTVRYGENGTYVTRVFTNGTPCTNEVFGDPLYGVVKHCDLSNN
jgi:Flp pilus assembly pilin Flp